MSFRLKTILGVALIESVLLLILVISTLNFLSQTNEEQLIQRAESTSRLFANATKDAVLATDLATLESFVEEILSNPAIVYTRISSDGVVLAEGGEPQILNRPHPPDRNLAEVGDGVFDVRAEISEGDTLYGVIEMGLSIGPIERMLAEARHWTVTIAGLEIILVALFSFILGTYLTRQLGLLTTASELITRSGPGHQIPVEGNDEIAEVSHAFNRMSSVLQQSYADLRDSLDSQKEISAIANRNQAKNVAILAASLDAVITIDAKGNVLEYSKVAETTFGWRGDEIVGQPVVDFIVPPEMREAHRRGMAHYLATGEGPILGQRLELSAQHREGRLFPIEISISPIETDQGSLFTAFIRDISERRTAATELRLAAQAFESSEAILLSSADANIIRVNSAFTRITGYTEAEVLGQNPRIFKSGRHDAEFYKEMWNKLMGQGTWSGEIHNKRKNGEIYPEHLHISAVKDANGETTHYVAHFVDISEQKRNEERLRLAQREAEMANEAKGRFLATMSHEIRTPMNAVLGILELLDDSPLDSQQQQLVRTGRASGELLLSIINDVLDYSKMDAGKLQLAHTGFDLHRLFDHVVELLKIQAEPKGLALELTLEPGLPRYGWGDPDRLRQILINLGTNAVKFTPSGRIHIRASAASTSDEVFTLHCEVEDTGIGIPEELQAMLFEEFTMADQSYSRVHEGTGLGLAICKRLVALMHGSIDVTSEPGNGSTFSFSVVLEPATEQACEIVPASDGPLLGPAAGIRVLLAEDNPTNQMVIKRILEKAGLQVDTVANGREAIEAVRSVSYDMVLMDISMPEMDGVAATREIRRLPGPTGRIPIVALTAHALSEDKGQFFESGMDDFLAKPIDRTAALRCIAHWAGRQIQHGPESAPDTTEPREDATSTGGNGNYVDLPVLQQLEKDTSPEIVPELLTLYIDDARKRVEQIQKAVTERDIETLEFEAHTLGSSAAAHGNPALHNQARKVERLCREGEHEEALVEAATLPAVAAESFRLLGKHLSEMV